MELSSSQSAVVYTCKSVSVHGKLYKRGCGLVLDYNEHDEPQFGILLDIAVVKHVKYFIVEKLHANSCLHILPYVVQRTNIDKAIFSYSSLRFPWPLSIYQYNGESVIMNTNSHTYALPFWINSSLSTIVSHCLVETGIPTRLKSFLLMHSAAMVLTMCHAG